MRLSHFILMILWCVPAAAQNLTASFNGPSSGCKGEKLQFESTALGDRIEWDFCQGDLQLTPTAQISSTVNTSSSIGFDVLYDGSSWFGFVADAANNTIVRLNYGADLTSTPSVVPLGDIFGQDTDPYDIKIVFDNGNWYGFVYGVSKLITRLDFGNSPTNTPTSQVIIDGTGTTSGLDVVFSNGNWYVLYTTFYTLSIAKLTTINSLPDAADIVSTTLPDSNIRLGDLKAQMQNDHWFIYTVAYQGAPALYRFAFGSNLFSVGTVSQISTNEFSGLTPFGVDIATDEGRYVLFASTLQGSVVKFNLGEDLNQPVSSSNALGNLGQLSNTLRLTAVKTLSRWHLFTISYNNGKFFRVDFPEASCSASVSSSASEEVTVVFTTSGSKGISLRSFNGNRFVEQWATLVIQNLNAPEISIQGNSICLEAPTTFSVQSADELVSVTWNFGDGATSTEINPSHTFAAAGTYDVGLRVTSVSGCQNFYYTEYQIYPSPLAAFTVPPGMLCSNNQIQFSNETVDVFDGNLQYEWAIDNVPASVERNAHLTFTDGGIKTVTLRVSIPGCVSELSKATQAISEGPIVDFLTAGKCDGGAIIFEETIVETIESFAWDFGNGVESTLPIDSHVFAGPGTYNVTLSAVSPNGCNNSQTKTITVYSRPNPDFQISSPPYSCSASITPFENLTPDLPDSDVQSSYWTFGDQNNSASNEVNPHFVYPTAGNYIVTLTTTTNEGCTNTIQKPITIAQSPSVTLTNSSTCVGVPSQFTATGSNIASYFWEIGTSYYTTANVTHSFSTPGSRNISVQVTGTNNCITTLNKTITVPARLTPDFSVTKNCKDVAAVFTDITTGADPVASRLWNFNGAGTSADAIPTFTFGSTGAKSIKLDVTSVAGCQYSVTKDITVVEKPVAAFHPSYETAVPPIAISFTNQSQFADEYDWSFETPNGNVTSTQSSPEFTFTELGEYAVTLKARNDEGCEDFASRVITLVSPLPDVDLELISLSQNPDGTWKVIITIHNKGNTILGNLPVAIDISGQFKLNETVVGPIDPNGLYNLVLSYSIQPSASLDFLCAETQLEGDLAPSDNRICKDFENSITIIPAYPNPANENLTLEWVASGGESIEISMIDSFGKQIGVRRLVASEGLNQLVWNVRGIRDGLYILTILAKSEAGLVAQKTQRILIHSQN